MHLLFAQCVSPKCNLFVAYAIYWQISIDIRRTAVKVLMCTRVVGHFGTIRRIDLRLMSSLRRAVNTGIGYCPDRGFLHQRTVAKFFM